MARYSKINSFNALKTLTVASKSYQIFSLSITEIPQGFIGKFIAI